MGDKPPANDIGVDTSKKKSIADVLDMEGNDELKFGVLISLIKLKQIPTKDVISTILNLVS